MGIPEADLTSPIRAALGQLMSEVQNLRQELGRAKKRIAFLEELSDRDPLVPVLNRRAFVRELSRFMAFAERYGVTGSVIYFDVNGMKGLNDTLGHPAGDAALTHVTNLLMASVRESDIVGRLGGDEFAVILAQADKSVAATKAQELADRIANSSFEFEGYSITVMVSFGVCCFTGSESVDAALDAADRAMYEHKRTSAAQVRIEPASPAGQAGKSDEPMATSKPITPSPSDLALPLLPPSAELPCGADLGPTSPPSVVGQVMPAGQILASGGVLGMTEDAQPTDETDDRSVLDLDPSGLPRLRSDS
tara:strand:- start:626 stop:1546 length:921 start_codon:yes stop_codon:yes gene_type:complete